MIRLYRLAALVVVAMLVVIGSVAPLTLPANAALVERPLSVLGDNLIAYWKLDEANGTRYDEVATINGCGTDGCDLTDNNTVLQAAGKLGYAAQFVAANTEYLSHADHNDLDVADIDFVFTAWVWMDSLTTSQAIIAKWTDSGGGVYEYLLRYFQPASAFQFYLSNGSGTFGNVYASTFGTPSINTWNFIVLFHDAANNQIGISVNNGTTDTASYSAGGANTTAPFAIGAYPDPSIPLNGRVDSVGFWRGRLLSSDERTLLWNSGDGCDYPFTACEATATPVNTATSTATNTATATYTATATATHTATATATNTATATDTATATNTATETDTPTAGPSPTATETATATVGPSPTVSATPEDSFSVLLSSGNRFFVDRHASFGEGYIAVGIIGVIVVLSFRFLYDVVHQWLS